MITAAPAITTPVGTAERMDVLDAVRGVAVLGILVMNVDALSGYAFVPNPAAPGARFDETLLFLLAFLAEGKFYALFSFLFGVGFAVFVERASARGADPARLFQRRLSALLLIGFIHTIFIWMGDILLTYAVLGFGLVPFLRKDDRTVMRWAIAMLLLPIALYAIAAVLLAIFGIPSALVPPPAAAEAAPGSNLPPFLLQAVHAFAHGNYVNIVQGNAAFTVAQIARRFVLMFFPRVFGMFLLGFLVGRRNIFADVVGHRTLLSRTALFGFLIGVPLAFLGAYLEGSGFPLPNLRGVTETTAKSIAIPALALAYAAGLCLLFQRARTLMRFFAPVGRMALTNYLTHSIAGIIVFYGIGFGLFGKVSLTVSLALAIGFYVLQMFASGWWLTRATFGPAEWVWRMMTYRRRLSLFKAA